MTSSAPSCSSTPRSRSPASSSSGPIEEAIQSAYRRTDGRRGHPRPDRRRDRQDPRLPRPHRGRRGRGPADRVHPRRGPRPRPERPARRPRRDRGARSRGLRPDPRPDRQAGRPAAPPRGRARRRLRPVRQPRGRDHHRHRQPGRAAGDHPRPAARAASRGPRRSSPRPSSRRVEHYRIGQNVKAYVLEVRRGLRGPAALRQPGAQGLPAPAVRARGPRDPRRHGRDQGDRPRGGQSARRSPSAAARRASTRSAPRSASAARGSRRSWPSSAGEKIDVIPWNDDPAVFVANALSPAQVLDVDIDEEHRIASVTVPERMLSLAIGREGQNARLAAKLTGWRIDIRSDVSVAEAKAAARPRAWRRQPSRRPRTPPSRPRRGEAEPREEGGPAPEADGATEVTAAKAPRPSRRRPRRPSRRRPPAKAEPAATAEPAEAETVAKAEPRREAQGGQAARPKAATAAADEPDAVPAPKARAARKTAAPTADAAAAPSDGGPCRRAGGQAEPAHEGRRRRGVVVARPAPGRRSQPVPIPDLRRLPDDERQAGARPDRPDARRTGPERSDRPARRPRRLPVRRRVVLGAWRSSGDRSAGPSACPLPPGLRDELSARAGTMSTMNEGGSQRGEE